MVAPLKNDPILSGRSIWSFRHLELQNPSIISDFRHRARLVQEKVRSSSRSRSSRRSGTTLLSVTDVGLSSHYNPVSPVVLLGGVPHVSKDFRDCSLSHAAQLKRWPRRDEVSTRTESIRTHTFRLGHINQNIQMSAFSNC